MAFSIVQGKRQDSPNNLRWHGAGKRVCSTANGKACAGALATGIEAVFAAEMPAP
jgi:hypothetical protein